MYPVDSQLLTFVTVVEKKSFSLAARELHLTQPAVTAQIHNMEKHYGVKLFNRDNKYVRLTPAGQKLYEYARQIIDLYNHAYADIKELGGIIHGRLSVGATYTIAEYILPQIIGFFKTEYPEVEIAICLGNREEIFRALNEERCDIILVAGDCHSKKVICENWLTDTLVLVVNSDHPWAERGRIAPDELFEERFILREVGSSSRQLWENALREKGFEPAKLNVFLELNNHEAIKKWVELNFGVSVLSEWVIIKEVELKTLAKVNIEGLSLCRNINLIYPKHRLHPVAEKFLRFCRVNKSRFLSML